MPDRWKIAIGAVIFIVIFTFPFWYSLGKRVALPEPEISTPEICALEEKKCVESTSFMRVAHMKLLNRWRDDVVRNGHRLYRNSAGEIHEMSLSGNCLKCHSNKERFCDRCHDSAGVKPNCFICHNIPEEDP